MEQRLGIIRISLEELHRLLGLPPEIELVSASQLWSEPGMLNVMVRAEALMDVPSQCVVPWIKISVDDCGEYKRFEVVN